MKLVVESAPTTVTESWGGVLSQQKIEALLLEGRDAEQAKTTNDQCP